MAKFRKKPVVIEAVPALHLMDDAKENWKALPDWIRAAYDAGKILFLSDGIQIKTLEGSMKAERTDWVIQGVKGEIYPCKPDIFGATYEVVEE